MAITKQTTIALCPDCEEELNFSRTTPKVGLKITCPNCEAPLAVVSVRPLELAWDESDEFEDDWDADEDW